MLKRGLAIVSLIVASLLSILGVLFIVYILLGLVVNFHLSFDYEQSINPLAKVLNPLEFKKEKAAEKSKEGIPLLQTTTVPYEIDPSGVK